MTKSPGLGTKSFPELLAAALQTVLVSPALSIPLRQRAKFEGWLKIELARALESLPGIRVEVESEYDVNGGSKCRADLRVGPTEGVAALVMLKTSNTNFRFDGVESRTRPITKNVAGIVEDVQKLIACVDGSLPRYAAFVFFPVSYQDESRAAQLAQYLARIQSAGANVVKSDFVLRGPGWGIGTFIAQVSLPSGTNGGSTFAALPASSLAPDRMKI